MINYSIVAITFTRMAADEMRQRLGTKSNGMFVGTIHSYANYICRLNKISNYEEITEEKYAELSKYLKPLDFSYLGEDSIGEKFCSNDTCEI